MLRTSLRPFLVMGMLIAVLLVITAGAGISVEGLYSPFLDESLVAFQFFQDFLSLLFVPLLVVVMVMAQRGSLRAYVIWVGLLIYAAYYYAFYCFDFVYTLYYPLYLAVMGLSTFSFIGLLSNTEIQFVRERVDVHMPVRLISGVLGMTVLFTPIWLSMMIDRIQTQQVGTTDLVFVLDLAFLIPACAFAAVQIWRRRPIGYLLCGPLLFKAAVSGVLLTGGEFLKMQRGIPLAIDQLALYLFLATAGLTALVLYMRYLQDVPNPNESRTAARHSNVRHYYG